MKGNDANDTAPRNHLAAKAILLGLLASVFFAVTFVFNQSMTSAGGSWIWSASLRYFFMTPLLLATVAFRGNMHPLVRDMGKRPGLWVLWGTVGFGCFYAPLTFAASFGPSWLIAGTFQVTIIAGVLLSPFLHNRKQERAGLPSFRFPLGSLAISLLIIIGIGLMQAANAGRLSGRMAMLSTVPVVVAAFAYPLGNRRMMLACGNRLDAYQRVLGMTLGSLPFWFVLSTYGVVTAGWPLPVQVWQSFVVAVCSGVIATVLFYTATTLVRDNPVHLAAVEATQAGEVIFSVLGSVWFLSSPPPSPLALGGIGLVMIGMALHGWLSTSGHKPGILPSPAPTGIPGPKNPGKPWFRWRDHHSRG